MEPQRAYTWVDVEAAWEDPDVHDAFLVQCRDTGNLRHAAECYRNRLAQDPEDPIALKRRQQIMALAMMSMNLEAARREAEREETPSRRGSLPLLLALVGAAIGGLAGFALPAGEMPVSGAMKAVPFALGGGFGGLVLGLVFRRSPSS